MSLEKKRYIILGVLFINQLTMGGTYAWSVFSQPISEQTGWPYDKVTIAYSLLLFLMAFTGIIGGKLLDRFGPKVLMMAAAMIWGVGWFCTGFSQTIWQLYLFFGILSGLGVGLFYNPAITTAVRWFPDKKGLASGLIVGAVGLSPLIIAPVSNLLLTNYGVMSAFRIIGLIFFCVALFTTWMISSPKPGWVPAGYVSQQSEKGKEKTAVISKVVEKTWREMFKDKLFYVMWIAFLGCSFSGIMIIGHAAGIGKEIADISSQQASWMVGIMAVANFFGRFIMGGLSDWIGRFPTLMLVSLVSVADMILLYFASGFIMFTIGLVVAGVCFGGVLAVFPTITSEAFGMQNMGTNYGVMFTAYGISAIVGPMVAASFKENTGSYSSAFLVSAVFAAVSFVLIVITSKIVYSRQR